MFIIAFFFDKNSGKGCQPRPSRGAYFTIFKLSWSTLASRRPDLSRINFALNSLIRFVKIWRELIYGFAKAETVSSRMNIRVGEALRYCSKGCLFSRGLTGSYFTWTVIHNLAAPPNPISCLWRSNPQSTRAPKSAWSRSGTALKRGKYLIWQKLLTETPMRWLSC